MNGARIAEFDLWTRIGVVPTGAQSLGEIALSGSGDVLRLEDAGKNQHASAPFYQFGIDGVRLSAPTPAAAGEGAAAPNADRTSSEPDRAGVDGE